MNDVLEEGRGVILDIAESELYKKIESGNLTAIIFFLKTQGKDRGYTERTEFDDVSDQRKTIDELFPTDDEIEAAAP